MREIKFRAWNKETKIMVMDVQNLYDHLGTFYNNYGKKINSYNNLDGSSFGCLLKDDKLILQQYTGLKDINGKEIYEGDIVKNNFFNVKEEIGYIRCNGTISDWSFVLTLNKNNEIWHKTVYDTLHEAINNCEVIGNIYETPELLK